MVSLSFFWVLVSIFVVALILRINNLGADPYGDEAYYFWLTKYPLNYFTDRMASSHPPLLYFLYHFLAQDFVDFRIENIIVGSLIPCIVYLILDVKKVSFPFKVLASSFLIVDYLFVKYSAIVFLDMLGTFFALLALLFYFRGNLKSYILSLFLSIMVKEFFVIFGLAIIGCVLFRDRKIHFSSVAALFGFGIWADISYRIKGLIPLPLTGHGFIPFSFGALNTMFISAVFIPLFVVTFKKENFEFYAVALAFPIFLYFWGNTEEWYLLLPIAISACLLALSLDRLTKTDVFRSFSKPVGIILLVLVSLFFVSNHQIVPSTINFIQTHHGDELFQVSQFLREYYPNQSIIMIDCFWAYSNYPIGEFMHISRTYWSWQMSFESLQSEINQIGLCLLEKEYGNPTIELQLKDFFAEQIVYSNDLYVVIAK